MSDTFDGLPGLNGAITGVLIRDHDGNPNKVLDNQFPFDVKVEWTVGPAATAILLDGTWRVRAYAESLGPGPEIAIGSVTRPANGGLAYKATINVPAGKLPADVGPDSGVYKLVVVITYRTHTNAPTEMAAFREGPTFMLRQP